MRTSISRTPELGLCSLLCSLPRSQLRILKLDGKDEAADGEEGQDQEEAVSHSEDEGAPKKKMSFGEEVMDAMNQAVASEDVDGQKFRRAVHELV